MCLKKLDCLLNGLEPTKKNHQICSVPCFNKIVPLNTNTDHSTVKSSKSVKFWYLIPSSPGTSVFIVPVGRFSREKKQNAWNLLRFQFASHLRSIHKQGNKMTFFAFYFFFIREALGFACPENWTYESSTGTCKQTNIAVVCTGREYSRKYY